MGPVTEGAGREEFGGCSADRIKPVSCSSQYAELERHSDCLRVQLARSGWRQYFEREKKTSLVPGIGLNNCITSELCILHPEGIFTTREGSL